MDIKGCRRTQAGLRLVYRPSVPDGCDKQSIQSSIRPGRWSLLGERLWQWYRACIEESLVDGRLLRKVRRVDVRTGRGQLRHGRTTTHLLMRWYHLLNKSASQETSTQDATRTNSRKCDLEGAGEWTFTLSPYVIGLLWDSQWTR